MAVAAHCTDPSVVLFVKRWVANLFMHYAFDAWMARKYPTVQFERYADDAVVHAVTNSHANRLMVRDQGQDGAGWAAVAPGQDQDRVLQGREAEARS